MDSVDQICNFKLIFLVEFTKFGSYQYLIAQFMKLFLLYVDASFLIYFDYFEHFQNRLVFNKIGSLNFLLFLNFIHSPHQFPQGTIEPIFDTIL